MSTVETNLVQPSTGTTLTLGASGDTVAVGTGASTSGFDSGLASVQTFTSSGTWTRPSGITKVIMKVQGAGGGGSHGTQNSGGGGGGYCEKFLNVSSISTSTITVGAAGAAVASGATGNGGDGDSSIWADGTNTVTAGGGDGGDTTTYVVSDGGTATGGDVNIVGQSTMNTPAWNSPGDSVLGFGGLYPATGASAGTQDGKGYGGGGSGWSGYTLPTGAGGPGIVIVWEYK